ncbi:Protein RRP5 [Araneus ventricosus]|uniref:Protein RRP5 n=1 Tax=Araneus ventricosus TaxID=182803 RepID=A0A4Y2JW60_ARAVE|nr:Protein RRP5 [Araneus ventricosus]
MKKRHGTKGNSQKRKKQKAAKEIEKPDVIKAEVLDAKTLREGMLLLGCVIEIRANCFLMSLPGCLVGKVPLAHISNKYSEIIRSSEEEEDGEEEIETDLHSIVELGAVYPCKVLNVSNEERKRPSIVLSINPQDVNGELRLSSLFLKMVLHVAVQSVEDHGYVMDIGIKGAQGFLPFSASSGQKNLIPGQIIPTSVRKLPSQKGGNVVWLSELSLNDQFPEVEDDSLKLTSLLPGTNIATYITEIKSSFLYGKCMDFDACTNAMSLGNLNITEACKTSGTILYIHPVTHMIYLLLGPKPTPKSFKNFFKVKKFDVLRNVKYQHTWHHRLFFKAHHGTTGFVKQNEIEKTAISVDALSKDPVVPMARVVFLHYMDKLVHLSFNKKMLELEIVRLEDVQIGDIYKATVKKHTANGMFVTVCVSLSGFVRQIHISDAFVTMPEKLHPVGSQVNCRVLSLHPVSGLNLTCKESLLNLPKEGVLKSYEQAHPGQMYKGVIVQKTDAFILVLFFNDVKGVVPSEHIPESSVFFIGQTVPCRIIQCKPEKQKLKLSLLGDKHFTQNSSNTMQSQKSSTKTKTKNMLDLEKGQLDPKKTHKAVIKSITGHQLNILLDGGLIGRVHITELGCSEEDFMPLKQFKAGKNLKVHVIGSNARKSVNYLAITHQNMKHFCECSFEYPPPVPLQKEFFSGMSLMGFVKEVGDTSASIWLSPTQTGTLDYLHFSDNPKVLRKLKKKLKVGLSLSVSILDVEKKSKEKDAMSKISLTKIDCSLGKAAGRYEPELTAADLNKARK